MQAIQKKYTPQQAKLKAENFCAYQERCQQEIRNKLYDWGLHNNEVETIIASLIEENFLNEERFSLSYARGKFNLMHWGKTKIKMHLKQKKISDRLIQKALNQIDEATYLEKIQYLATKKMNLINEKNEFLKRKKVFAYLNQKGYESDIINLYLKINDL